MHAMRTTIIDILDIAGDKRFLQFQNVHDKDYGSSSQSDKTINGSGEMFFFGDMAFNDMDRKEHLESRFPTCMNNILYPKMWNK